MRFTIKIDFTPPRRLCVSFSGGETSAFMTQWIMKNWRDRYDEIVTVFANTSAENEATLEFIEQCDRHFNMNVVWVEADLSPVAGEGVTARVVDFKTAHRNNEVFEPIIRKYGIPNKKFPHCTKHLKRRAIENYLRQIGWKRNTYDVAIGIRADEIDRMNLNDPDIRMVYPLVSAIKMTKPKINTWWNAQPFRLRLKSYQGNCKWCWKKSMRKHLTIIDEDPTAYDFARRMERDCSLIGPEFRKEPPPPEGYRRTFFRENKSVDDLFAEHARRPATFKPADDDGAVFDPDLDVGEGCEETCEVY